MDEKKRYAKKKKNLKKRKKLRQKRIRNSLVFLLVLFCFALLAYGSIQLFRTSGKKGLFQKAEGTSPDLSARMETEKVAEAEEDTWQDGWVKYQGEIYAYNEDILTFLIMGIDKNSDAEAVAEGTDGGQADALFLAVMNPHDKNLRVVAINRNTMTDIDIYDDTGSYVRTVEAQIAVQHGFGNGVEESCEYQKKAVSRLFYDLPIHGYAAINMSAIPALNDAVGGVDVSVLEDLTRIDKSLVEGENVHLMGESAFWYVKYRDTDQFESADKRLARQKQYLNAFIGKAKAAVKQDVSVALDLYQALQSQMVTDISLDEVAYLAPVLAGYTFDNSNFYTLQGETVMGEQFEEFYADEDALYELILEVFYEKVETQ